MKDFIARLTFLTMISFSSSPHASNERAGDSVQVVDEPAKSASPMASVGIEQGDILVSVNGIKFDDPKTGLKAFQAMNEPKRLVIRLIRNGKEKTIIHEAKSESGPKGTY